MPELAISYLAEMRIGDISVPEENVDQAVFGNRDPNVPPGSCRAPKRNIVIANDVRGAMVM